MYKDIKQIKERLFKAGDKAIDELIKVLEDSILGNAMLKEGKEVSADKMKNAAAAKRLAFDDALYMIEKIEKEREKIEEADEPLITAGSGGSFLKGRNGGRQ